MTGRVRESTSPEDDGGRVGRCTNWCRDLKRTELSQWWWSWVQGSIEDFNIVCCTGLRSSYSKLLDKWKVNDRVVTSPQCPYTCEIEWRVELWPARSRDAATVCSDVTTAYRNTRSAIAGNSEALSTCTMEGAFSVDTCAVAIVIVADQTLIDVCSMYTKREVYTCMTIFAQTSLMAA